MRNWYVVTSQIATGFHWFVVASDWFNYDKHNLAIFSLSVNLPSLVHIIHNGLLPGRLQAIIWTNAGILLIWPLGTNFNEILITIHIFSVKKMHLKMLSGKWPFCLSLNVLITMPIVSTQVPDVIGIPLIEPFFMQSMAIVEVVYLETNINNNHTKINPNHKYQD